jgi:serine protease Do
MNRYALCFFLCVAALAVRPVRAAERLSLLIDRVMPSAVNISARLTETQDRPNVVNNLLFATSDGRFALGAGFVVSADGYIATNRHVVEHTDAVTVRLADERTYEARLVGVDEHTDVALLKIEPEESLQAVTFGNSDLVSVGDSVMVIGNPFGLENSVSVGIISARSRDIGDGSYDDFLQTDAAINQGNSGGPMFNRSGEVIGMSTAIYSENGFGTGVGFALPSNQAAWVIEKLRETGRVERSTLGVVLKEGRTEDGTKGFAVSSIEDLAQANDGLQVGDLIVSGVEADMKSVKDFQHSVARLPVGTTVHLVILRDGKQSQINVKTSLMKEKDKDKTEESDHTTTQSLPYGLEIKGTTVAAVRQGSEAERKGIRPQDKIIKLNGKTIREEKNLKYYINESFASRLPLRLDLEDLRGEPYFVEFVEDGEDTYGTD